MENKGFMSKDVGIYPECEQCFIQEAGQLTCKHRAIDMCKYCHALGDSMPSQNSTTYFYTLTADPYRDNFIDKIPDQQYKWYKHKLQLAVADIRNKYPTAKYSAHFEFNKSGELHIHGLIKIQQSDYDIHRLTIQKLFHRHIGRPKSKSEISSQTLKIRCLEHNCRYVNKENAYPPIHDNKKLLDEY